MRTAVTSHPTLFSLFFLLLLLGIGFGSQAQEIHCGTVQHNQDHPSEQFERWLQSKIYQKQARTSASTNDEPIYRIPVVVHVVHRGEEVGDSTNISLEQIQDQIRILNEDFRRQNPDTVNTPDMFLPVAADTRIEFVLALRDPEGLPTNGVVRVEANQQQYDISDASILGELSQWDPDLYMNIWVAPLGAGIIGFAQLPISDLPGLEGSSDDPASDGVVADYRAFGSIGDLREANNRGRTTTHEVGHYLGLRHVWGDGGCDVDDFVDDTPPQGRNYGSQGCPEDAFTCGSVDMYDNYMDYTDDECMNLFTEGQKLRMRTVLENSPRRNSLLSSPALEAPLLVADDASISRIINPQPSECDAEFVPRVVVRNTGNNIIQEVSIALDILDQPTSVNTFDLNLAPGETQVLEFPPFGPDVLVPGVVYESSFGIVAVNGDEDTNQLGNRQDAPFFISQEDEIPLVEDFQQEGGDSYYDKAVIINPDRQITWERRVTPTTTDPNNQSLFINFLEYERLGERDFFYGPTLDLRGLTTSTVRFRVAYAQFENRDFAPSQDGLLVGVSTDCGATVEEIVYEKFGEELSTQPTTTDGAFVPTSEDDWREEIISFDAYLGEPNVQLVFIGVNDYGNNLYLDDIEFFVTEYDSLQPDENNFSIEPNPVQNNQLQVEFNLQDNDDITIAIYSSRGQLLGEYAFPNTLNQTYSIDMSSAPTGVYVLRAVSSTLNEAKQFIIP